ncbi:hypothetical protein KUTeg_003520 [Tegillarca granosa]|uniref:ATP synthase F0 subunit 8 n=1 Tax=Tegillarca granosa TaxID=220873 RepID=A0ABQ9FMD6_TEGGR|nr:hypothetical protein KUTeg_003520 [Tegillarca granosa]
MYFFSIYDIQKMCTLASSTVNKMHESFVSRSWLFWIVLSFFLECVYTTFLLFMLYHFLLRIYLKTFKLILYVEV